MTETAPTGSAPAETAPAATATATAPTEPAPRGSARAGTAPTGIVLTVNGTPRELPATTTLAELVATVSRANTGVAAALNEAVVPRSSWSETPLSAGDRIEILTAVQGG
ncbi:sulfur carrier protein ThiS [Kitasatospora sp. NPDC085464]|uniref:sulfur carrier protein ThiS n=1 Tax=Kitasatospora sp. NPDC085464 TaxID=3364063 RepID=UPI0037C94E6C